MKLHLPKQLFTALLAAITLAAPAWGDWSGNSYYVTGAENESFSTENGTTDNTAAGLLFVRVDAPAGTPTTKTATISTLTLAQKNEAYTLRISGHWDDPSKMFEALTIEDLASEATNAILEIYGGNTVSVQALTGTLNSLTNGGNLTLGTTEDTTNSFELGDITNSGTLTIHGDVTADSIVNDSITTIGRLADPENDISAIAPTVNVGSATISSGASLNILNGSLTSTGDFTNNGSLTVNSGASLISNGTFTNAAGASITINGNFTNSGTLVLGSTMLGTGTVTNSGNGVIKLGDYSLLNFANVTYVGGGTSGFIDSLSVFADTLTYSGSVYVGDTAYTVTDGNITLNGADKTYYVNEDLTYDADTMGGATHYSVEEGGVFDFTGYDLGDENTATNDKTLIGIMNKMSGAGTVKLASGAVIQTCNTKDDVKLSTNYKVEGNSTASLTLTSWRYNPMTQWRTWLVDEGGSITVGDNGEGTLSILAGQRLSIQNGGQVSVGTLKLGHPNAADNPGSLVMSGSGSKLTVGGIVMQNGIDGTVLNEVSITGGTLKVTGATAIAYNADSVKTTVTLGGSDAASSVLLQTGTATGWVMSKQRNAASTFNVGYVTIDGANTQSITFNGATLTGAITNNASLILGEDVVWSGATVSNAGTLQINKGTGDMVLNNAVGILDGAYKNGVVTNTATGNLVLANTGNKTLSGNITIGNGGKVTLQGGTFGTADAAISGNISQTNNTTLVLDGVEAYLKKTGETDQILGINTELTNGSVMHLLGNDRLNWGGGYTLTLGLNSLLDVGSTRQSLSGNTLKLAGGTVYGSGGLYPDGKYNAGLDYHQSGTITTTENSLIATAVAARDANDVVTLNVAAEKALTIGSYTAGDATYTGSFVGLGSFTKTSDGTVLYKGAAFTNGLTISGGVFEYYMEDDRSHTGSISGSGTFRKSGSGTLTLDSAYTSVTTLNVAGGKLVYNSSTDTTSTLTGSAGTTFEKTGSSTLIADINNLKGELLISAGTLKLNANATATTTNSQVPWRSVTVGKDAVFDINGKPAYNNLTLESGSTLSNSASGTDPGASERQLPTITLTGAATMNATGHIRMLGGGHDVTALYLGGHTLTKTGAGTFFMQNTHVKTGGTIQINEGLVKAYTHNGKTQALNGLNLYLNGGNFELAGSSQSIQNLTLTSGTLTIGSGLTLTTMGDVSMSGGTVSGNLCLSGTITLNGSVNMGSATLSGTSLGGFTRVESAEQPATSGLQTLTYQLWSGDGSITTSQSTISVGGVNYEMDAATGTFTTAGTVYYVATGDTITVGGDSADEGTASATSFVVDGSLSVAADTSTESINGSAGTVNVAEATTLTLTGTGSSIGTLSAANGTVALAAGSSLYLGQTGENAQETTSSIGTVNVAGASTIHLNEKATLSSIKKTGNGSITLSGSGVYDLGSITTNAAPSLNATLGAGWTGTVAVSTGDAAFNLMNFGTAYSNAGSKLQFTSFKGYIQDTRTFAHNLILVNGKEDAAYGIRLMNGSSGTTHVITFSGSVEGDGNLLYSWANGSDATATLLFSGDTSDWNGKVIRKILMQTSDTAETTGGKPVYVKFTAGGNVFRVDGNGGVSDAQNRGMVHVTIDSTQETNFNGTLENINTVTVNNDTVFNKAVTATAFTANGDTTFNAVTGIGTLTGAGHVTTAGNLSITNALIGFTGELEVQGATATVTNATSDFTLNKLTLDAAGSESGASFEIVARGSATTTGYTYNIGQLAVSGTGTLANTNPTGAAGYQSQWNIENLTNTENGTSGVLNLNSWTNTANRSIINLNGGDFAGDINLHGASPTGSRKVALNINSETLAADAVVSLSSSGQAVALGIGADRVVLKGVNGATGSIVSGAQAYHDGETAYNNKAFGAIDTTFRTLVIDTDGTDNAVSENSATSASLGSYLNLEKQGVGTQTFSGNVGAFNGTLNVQGGTLAFTGSGNMTATGVSVADGANLTLGGTVGLILAGGTADAPATYSISSLTSAGNTITVSEHATLNRLSTDASQNLKLAGAGVYNLGSNKTANVSGLTDSTKWTGTVVITGLSGTQNDLYTIANSLANSNSTLKLRGVEAWLSNNYECDEHFELENVGETSALKLNNGYSSTPNAAFSGSIRGSGDMEYVWSGGSDDGSIVYTFGADTSLWYGEFISSSGKLKVTADFTKSGNVFSTSQDGGGIVNNSTQEMTVKVGSSEGAITFNGTIAKNEGKGAVNLNVTQNRVSFSKDANVDSFVVATDATATLVGENNSITAGNVNISREDASLSNVTVDGNSIAATSSTDGAKGTISNAHVEITQLQADASFTIQDMTLTNTTITAATPTTQVNLQNVTATDLALAQGKFTMNATPTVGTYNPETATGTLSYSNGLGVQTGASLTLNLDVMSAVTPEQHGVYDITVTLSGFGSDFTIESLDAIRGMVDFDPSSWLGQALVNQKAEYTVVTEQPPASSGESDVPTVSYAAGTGSNVGRLTITISGLNVPEPTTSTLSLIALAALAARRRRK